MNKPNKPNITVTSSAVEKSQPRIPKLRFAAFEGEWEEKRFKELLIEARLGGNYANTETETDKPLIKMGNLGRGNIVLNKIQYISDDEEINEKDKIQFGDLFFNTRNTLDLVGKVAIWNNELPIAYYNSNLMYIKFENNFFMNYKLNSFEGIKALRRLATGTTSVAAIYTKDLLKLKFNIPSNSKEQQKIANFLTAVDTKLQQLTTKKEQLELYKKGVMQQLFSQQLRFKPDNTNTNVIASEEREKQYVANENELQFPDWEKKRLGEVGKTFNGLTGKTKEDFGEGQPYIQYMQIFRSSKINSTEFGFVKINEKDNQFKVQYGDAFFTTSSETPNEIGTASVLLDKVNDVYLNSFCFGFRPNSISRLVPEFLQFLFRSNSFRRKIIPLAQGSTRYNMSKIELMKLKVSLPNSEEQQKIATFLSAIDAKIETVTQQIEQTQVFKKGLLQQMFV